MKLKVQGMEVIGFSVYFFLLFDLFLQYLIPFVRSFYSWLVVGGLRLVLEVYIVFLDNCSLQKSQMMNGVHSESIMNLLIFELALFLILIL